MHDNNLVGKVINGNRIERFVGKDKFGAKLWECLCQCGNLFISTTYKITSGRKRSCGCLIGSPKDLTGKRFGNQTVIGLSDIRINKSKKLWKCLCDCGKYCYRNTNQLTSGKLTSCGCERLGPKDNLVGKVFGRLTVISFQGKNRLGEYSWLCRCSCGKECSYTTERLLYKKGVRSCGCYRLDYINRLKLPEGESCFNAVYREYKRRSIKAWGKFELSKEDFKILNGKKCHYCGSEPSSKKFSKSKKYNYVYNGIDRVDNNIGYTISNSVPCCATCNLMKKDMTKNDFISHINKIHVHMCTTGE